MPHASRPWFGGRIGRLAVLVPGTLFLALAPVAARSATPETEGLPPDQAPGMFSGGLLNALFTGAPFTGPRLADIVIIGLGIFMLLRFLTGRRAPTTGPDRAARPSPPPETPTRPTPRAQPPAGGPADAPPGEPPAASPPDGREPSLARVYQAAESAWGGLRSAPKAPGTADAAGRPVFANQDEEFLAGAKAVYARIRAALDTGDVSGVAAFVDPAFQGELARLATARAARTGGVAAQLFLVDAVIVARESRDGVTRIQARYEVVAKLPGASGDDREREEWTFARRETTPGAMWLLTGIRPV